MMNYRMNLSPVFQIDSIKAIRCVTGLGLKESKNLYDSAVAMNPKEPVLQFTSDNTLEEMEKMLKINNFVGFIVTTMSDQEKKVEQKIELSASIFGDTCHLVIESSTGNKIVIDTSTSNIDEVFNCFKNWTSI